MCALVRILGHALLGLLLVALPASAVVPAADVFEPLEEAQTPSAVTAARPTNLVAPAPVAREEAAPTYPNLPALAREGRSPTLPVRIHVLHCVWRE